MKKMIFFAALTIPLMAGVIFTGYWSSTQKQKAAQAKMQALNAAEKAATAEEWLTFKSEAFFPLRKYLPDVHMVLVLGPRIPNGSVRIPSEVELFGHYPRLHELYAC